MAFGLLLVYILLLFLRPQEWITAIHGWPVIHYAAILTIAAAVVTLAREKPRSIRMPHNLLMLGLFGAMLMSHIAHGYWGGVDEGGMVGTFADFGKVLVLYFLIILLVTTPARLRLAALALIGGGLVMAWHGILQAQRGFGFGGELPIVLSSGSVRVRWVGIFHDPNDLALMLVAIIPFLLSKIFARRAAMPARVLSALACVPLVVCIFLTNSRGGWLALGVMCAAFAILHMKHKKTAVIIAALAFWGLVAVGPDRLGIGSSDASARTRVALWGDGNRMLKSQPLFGVGKDRFRESSTDSMVAHNSFIHCWAELGMVGYFAWLALLLAVIKDSYALSQRRLEMGAALPTAPPEPPTVPPATGAQVTHDVEELTRIGRAIAPALIGYLAAGMFLTRTYTVPLYVLLALGVAARFQYEQRAAPAPNRYAPKDLKWFLVAAVASVPVMWLTIRALN